MSVKIRLSVTGKRHQRSYRVVVQDTRRKRDGRFLEILGFYNPSTSDLTFDQDRYRFWLTKGAKPTEAVIALINQKQTKDKRPAKGSLRNQTSETRQIRRPMTNAKKSFSP